MGGGCRGVLHTPYMIMWYNRQTIRLRNRDYSTNGRYYITICTQNRECTFGNIIDNIMKLNESGKIVKYEWVKTARIRPNIQLDKYIIMPNHIHGIIIINNYGGVWQCAPTIKNEFRSPSQTIGSIIRGFKSAVTKHINKIRHTPAKAVWQRNYYEYIIRNRYDMGRIRQYIEMNPANWAQDQENRNKMDK